MIAEILATGDEIRTGALVDTNSAYVADLLEQRGIDVTRHQSVGDDLDVLTRMIDEISRRSDIAVVTGGLGPTVDDRTAEAAAGTADVPLELDQRAWDDMQLFFKERGRSCSPSNRKQAMIPQGAGIIYNPVGTAPGFSLKIGQCTFFFLPGVPYEMKQMFDGDVLPQIEKMMGPSLRFNMVHTLSTFGLPESVVGERVDSISAEFPGLTLGLRAKFPEIQVKFYLQTTNEQDGKSILNRADQRATELLGDHVFSHGGRTMADEVGRLLLDRGATLAVAESCTGGLIGNWLTNTSGSSDYFRLSAVTYHNQAKIDVLGVPEQTLIDHGAVHEETAIHMAQGARRVGRTTYGLATTGIAGPTGGSSEKPVGTVCIGISSAQKNYAKKFNFIFGRRLMNKRIFAMAALDVLRRELTQPVS